MSSHKKKLKPHLAPRPKSASPTRPSLATEPPMWLVRLSRIGHIHVAVLRWVRSLSSTDESLQPMSDLPLMGVAGRTSASIVWRLHLYEEVVQLLDEEGIQLDFFEAGDDETKIKAWDTNVMGRFICRNNGCHSRGWSSKKITI